MQPKDFINHLHPLTMTFFTCAIFVLGLVFSHPLYILGLWLAVMAVAISAGHQRTLLTALKFSLVMAIIILAVNAVFSPAGTELASINWGRFKLRVTREALAYGAGMSLRLFLLISIFALFNCLVEPDRLLALTRGIKNKTFLIIILCLRLFPLVVLDSRRIIEVQRTRGLKIMRGNLVERSRSLIPIFSVLLLTSLERSTQMAECLYARGYGSGPRSVYHSEYWHITDIILLLVIIVAFIGGLLTAVWGWSVYDYYAATPQGLLVHSGAAWGLAAVFALPALMNWGWKS